MSGSLINHLMGLFVFVHDNCSFLYMFKNVSFLVILIFSSVISTKAITIEAHRTDSILCAQYRGMLAAESQIRYDSFSPLFKKSLLNALNTKESITYSWDSLSRLISIKESEDGKLKFFSWDDRCGGTWHSIHCIAQFKTQTGKVQLRDIGTDTSGKAGIYKDSYVYRVYGLNDSGIYLSFAWGTHGAGHEHQLIQVYKIVGENLLACDSCLPQNIDPIRECSRGSETTLTFNEETQILIFTELYLDGDIGFWKAGKEQIRLKWDGNKFTMQ